VAQCANDRRKGYEMGKEGFGRRRVWVEREKKKHSGRHSEAHKMVGAKNGGGRTAGNGLTVDVICQPGSGETSGEWRSEYQQKVIRSRAGRK
jgi:hypothetical protein